jgi:O-antigen/teichoic acid export membrane protein
VIVKQMTALLSHFRSASTALRRRVGGDVVHALSGSILIQVSAGIIAFAMLSVAARTMPSAEFGHLAMWLSITQMGAVFAVLGQEMFILRALNEFMVARKPALARGALSFSCWIVAVVPLVCAAGLFLIGHYLLHESVGLMLTAGLYLMANSYIGFGGHVARCVMGMLLAEGTRELFWKTMTTAALLVVMQTHNTIDAETFLLIACASIAIAFAVQVTATRRALPRDILQARPERRVREWTRASFHLWVTTVLETLNQYFDVLVIYVLLDAPSAGVYFVATRIANAFGTLLTGAHVLATRRVPQLYFSNKIDEINRTFVSMAEVILVCIVIGISAVVFGAHTLLGFFGPSFAQQHWVLIVLVAGTSIYAAGGPAPAVLLICGHENKYPFVLAGNIILRLAGFAILIPSLGLIGAAIAATASLLVTTVILNVICRRWTGIDPSVLGVVAHFRRWLSTRQLEPSGSDAGAKGLQP